MSDARRMGQEALGRLTVTHAGLHAAYRRDSLAIVIVPTAGFAAAVAWAIAYGITWLDVALLVATYTVTVCGIDLGFHRYFAHRAFEAGPVARFCFAVAGCMAAQGRPVRWISNHRRHHAYSDLEEDPHSPHTAGGPPVPAWRHALRGLWHAHVAWIFRHEATNALHFAKDIVRDPMLAFVGRWYLAWIAIGMAVPAGVAFAVTGRASGLVEGVLWGWAAPVFLSQQIAFAVNSIGHYAGARPFDVADRSANNPWLAIPSIGAGWQNNHHAFPSSATTWIEWWQVDVGRMILGVLAWMGLVWDLKTPAPELIASRRRRFVAVASGAAEEA